MKKYITLMMCLIGVLCSFSSASASTSSALSVSAYADELAAYFGDEYDPPYGISNSGTDIDEKTGAVVTREADLHLPGKNGLDFKVIRRQSSQKTRHRLEGYSTEAIYCQFYVYHYVCDGKTILVHVPYEKDLKNHEKIYITDARLDSCANRADSDTDYYDIGSFLTEASDTRYEYTLDKTRAPLLISTGIEKCADVENNLKNEMVLDEDTLWTIEYKPIVELEYLDKIETNQGLLYGYFRDENGEVYPLYIDYWYAGSDNNDKGIPNGYYMTKVVSDGNNSFTAEINSTCTYQSTSTRILHNASPDYNSVYNIDDENSFNYLFKIISRDGKQYYFKSTRSGLKTGTSFEIQAIIDKYGNVINYNTMTDSMGRKIEVTSDGIKVTSGDLTQEIKYVKSTVNSDYDTNNNFVFDDTHYFTVYKNEYDGQNVLKSNQKTTYVMSKDQVIFNKCFSYCSKIEEIIYPTDGKTKYSYADRTTSSARTRFEYIPVVSASSDYIGSESFNNCSYSYSGYVGNLKYIKIKNNNTGVSTQYNLDNEQRIDYILTTDEYDNSVERTEYTYESSSSQYVINNDKLIQERINSSTYTTRMSQSTEYEYDEDYKDIIYVNDGYTETENTYFDGCNILKTSLQRPVNSTKGVLTVNTLTSDGKNIARSDVYEVTFKSATSSTETARVLNSTIYYTYDAYGNIATVKTNDGTKDITTQYAHTYNTDGSYTVAQAVFGVKDADGNTANIITHTKYDSLGRCISATDANGNTTTTEYTGNSTGALIKTTAPDGGVSTVSYDLKNNIIVAEEPNGAKTKYVYTKLGNLSKVYVTNDDGAYILSAQRTYDNALRPVSETVYKDYSGTTATEYVKTAYTYVNMPDSRIASVKSTDQNGNLIQQINYDYNKYEKLAKAHNADTSGKYYSSVTQTVTGDDTITPYKVKSYTDVRGLTYKEEAINPSTGAVDYFNTYLYDNSGNLLETKDMRAWDEGWTEGYTSKTEYDVFNRPVKQYDVLGNSVTTAYNKLGQVISTTDAKGNTTTYEYDQLGRNIMVTAPFTSSSTTSTKQYYDGNGNVIRTAQQSTSSTWNTITNTYDEMNRLETTKTGDGAITQYEYDSVGNVTKMAVGLDAPIDMSKADINGDYQLTTYKYDFKNALTETQDALGQAETYVTDMFGNVTEKTDRNGSVITATYNPYGAVLSQTVTKQDGTAENTQFAYDIMGNMKTMLDASGLTSYKYDSFNRLTKETKGNIIKEYSYDALGNRKSFTLTNGSETVMDTEYEYDKRNQLVSVINGNNTSSYTYDANGNMLTDTVNNLTTTYTYNNANLITKVANSLQVNTYAHMLNGNISAYSTQSLDGAYVTSYTYDNVGRLTSEYSSKVYKDYSYDKYGNIIAVTDNHELVTTQRAYDKNNRLLNEVSTNGTATKYYYDRNGNTTAKNIFTINQSGESKVAVGLLDIAGSNISFYDYNGLNQLVSMEQDGITSTYTYNGMGLRQSKTVNGVTINHIWDGTNMIAETNGTTVTNKYYRGANGIMYADLNGTMTRYLKDAHGNVTGLANMSGTALNKTYTYDAFGVEINKDETDTNPFRYCGEYYDNELDKIYLRARYYSPIQGRFMTEDPIKDGLNWYAYCSGDPVNAWDPSGLYTLGLKMALSELVRIGNVEVKDTGLYGSLRDISKVIGSDGSAGAGEVTWKEEGDGAVVTYTHPSKNYPYTIRITFDTVEDGAYASKVEYFYLDLNITKAMTNSVRDKITEQDAYFYLKADENNSGALVVQAKISTMFDIAGKNDLGQEYIAAWELANYLHRITGADLQDCLDFLANDTLLDIDYQEEPPKMGDYFPGGKWYDEEDDE